MKKIILAIALFATVSANAQNDGFFASNYNQNRTGEGNNWAEAVGLPGHGSSTNAAAPLGSGLLLLGGMALAYGLRKKN